jgi:membrane AbrB-like protein
MTKLPAQISALGVGLVGAVAFNLLGIPLPFLMGPLFACLLAALLRVPMEPIKPLNDSMRTILGIAVGATFTPALLLSMSGMWSTLILIPAMVFCIGLIGVPYFHRLCGYDMATSYYSAMPGGLQDMLVFGEEAGGNVRAMSLIHATRVMVIVVALPVLLRTLWDADLNQLPGKPMADSAFSQNVILFLCAIVGWQLAKRIGMFGASILGPMILAAAASLAGILHQRPPAEAIWLAQFFIGLTIGVKYRGITMHEVRHDVVAGLGYCGILMALTLGFVGVIHALELAPARETLLSFAPGGQAELTVLALIVGADMAFVVAHHVLRIFVVILGAPLFAVMFRTSS